MKHFLPRTLALGVSLFCSITVARSQQLPDIGLSNPHIEQAGTETFSVIEGSQIAISADLSFQSEETTVASIGFYLSRDLTYSSDDLLLTTSEISTFDDASTFTVSVNVPSTYIGDQHILILANPDLTILESSFENNLATASLTITKDPENEFDFELTDLALTGNTVNAGSSVELNYSTKTVNTSKTFHTVEGIYLSKNTSLDSDDHFLGEGTDASGFVSFLIPEGTDPGEWYILVKVDHKDIYLETDESNNLYTAALTVNPMVPVDLTIKSIGTSTEVISDESITLTVVFENLQNGTTPGFHFSFYYSEDNVFSSDDFLLYENDHTTLNGATETPSLPYAVHLPDYIPLGPGYIIGVIDDELHQAETDEHNNVKALSITVNPQPRPDLVFTDITVNPSVIGVGGTFSVTTEVLNQGTIASANFQVTYYLSEDSLLDESDAALYPSADFLGLGVSESLSRQSDYTIPAAADTGDFVILASVDPLEMVVETDEMNNDTTFALSVKAPDLVIVALQTDATVYGAGYVIEATVKARNQSEIVTAPSSSIRFYLSQDDLIDESDWQFTSQVHVADLLPLQIMELSASLSLPGHMEEGNYNLIASIDDEQFITETDDENNTFSSSLEVKLPDLTIKNAIISTSVVDGGGTTDARFKIENLEEVNSLGSSIHFYLSENETFEAELDTITLGNYFFEGLAGDSLTNELSYPLNVPDIPGGDFYVIFFLDADSALQETNESNNQASAELKINNADLTPINLKADPVAVGIGQPTKISFNVSNTGGAVSKPAVVGYEVRKAGEPEVRLAGETVYLDQIEPAGNSPAQEFILYVPDNFEQGEYYVIVIADLYDHVVEYDEENNKDSIIIEVDVPDLTVESPLVNPSVVSLGYTTKFEVTVTNEGDVTSPPGVVSHYLSVDQTLSEDDYFLTNSNVNQLKPGGDTAIVSTPVAIPAYFEEGDYYIIFKADGYESISETNEENNTAAAEINLKAPDLVVTNQATDKEVVGAGGMFTVTARVKNQSETAKAAASYLGYYLSADDILDEADLFMHSTNVSALELSSTSNEISQDFMIPASFEAGEYTLILVADYLDYINETDETNNIATVAITVENTDLTIDNLLLSSGVAENGDVINASVDIHNTGEVDAGLFYVSFYLSTADTLNDESILTAQYSIDKLAPGTDTTLSDDHVQIYLPTNLIGGEYNLIAFADSYLQLSETNEENNTVLQALIINTPDLLPSALETEDLTAGSPFDISFRIRNDGSVDVTSAVTVSVYLTSRDTIGGEGNEVRYLGQHSYMKDIQGNGTGDLIEKTFNAPIDIDTGRWYVALSVDPFDQIPETDNLNNTTFVEVNVAGVDIGINNAKVYPEVILPDTVKSSGVNSTSSIPVQAVISIFNTAETDIYSPHTNTEIYFSEDNVLDENDQLLKSLSDNFVSRKDTAYFGNITLEIRADIDPGQYYLLFLTDALDTINETNELNNLYVVSLQVKEAHKPDLTPVSLTTSLDEVAAGRKLSVVAKIDNAGQEEASSYSFSAILSTDEELDEEDLDLATYSTMEYLTPDIHQVRSVKSFPYEITIPENLSAGNYTLFTSTDSQDTIDEGDETNNSMAKTVVVRDPYPVDYAITFSSSLPEVIHAGSHFRFSYHLENLGTGLAEDTISVGYYLSADNNWDASDELLDGDTTTQLTPYDVQRFINGLTIPSATFPGSYYFIIYADNAQITSENNEANNIVAAEITIEEALAADLRITGMYANEAFYPNVSTTVYTDIQNIGKGAAERFTLSYYLSTNNIWSTDDLKLENFEVEQIQPGGQTYSGAWSVYLPLDVTLGSYFLIARADDASALEEGNEDNNTFVLPIEVGDAHAPDLIVELYDDSYSIYEGETTGTSYQISTFIFNEGNTTLINPRFSLFLSFDEAFDDADIELDLSYEPYIEVEPFGNTFIEFPVIFPDNLIAGDYMLFIQGDPENELIEFNEDNNLASATLTVHPPSKADLAISDIYSLEQEVHANSLLEVYYSVQNLDRASTFGAMISFYLSKDPVLSGEDAQIGEDSLAYLGGHANQEYSSEVFIDPSVTIGTYYVLVSVDPANAIEESNENNNVAGHFISVLEAAEPNLSIVSLDIPAVASANSVVSFSGMIYNDTIGSALDVELSIFLSEDEEINEGDVSVYSEIIGNLGGESYLNIMGDITIPIELSGQSFFVLAMVDPENTIPEANEEDNTYLTSITIGETVYPDLLVSEVNGLGDFIHAGQSDDFTLVIQNASEGFANDFTISGYLSEDAILDATDPEVFAFANEQRLSSGYYSYELTFSAESNVSPGDYTFILTLDDNNEVEETDETNNSYSAAITVGEQVFPDLMISSLQVNPQQIHAALNATVSAEVVNNGLSASDQSTMSFFLSSDQTWDGSDPLLGDEIISSLEPGAEKTILTSVTIPGTASEGDHYVIAIADRHDELQEQDETNNESFYAIEVLERLYPDLTITSAVANPNPVNAGLATTISFSVKNAGEAPAPASSAAIFLSSNETLDSNDEQIGTASVSEVASGASVLGQASLTIPVDHTPGAYFIIIEANNTGSIDEADNTNNTHSFAFEVLEQLYPDLTVADLALTATSLSAGTNATLSFNILNIGEAQSGNSTVKIYFSEDNVLDDDDEEVNSQSLSAINTNASAPVSAFAKVPVTTPEGTYYFMVDADAENSVEESDEDNNQSGIAVIVTKPLPADLTVTDLVLGAPSVDVGGSVDVEIAIHNLSANDALSSKVGLYISSDESLDEVDVLLGEVETGIIEGESSETLYTSAVIPSSMSVDDYYVIAMADHEEALEETNETNNSLHAEIELLKPLGIETANGILMYPNPVVNDLNIIQLDKVTNEILNVEVFSLDGRSVLRMDQKVRNGSIKVPMGTLKPGGYLILLKGEGIEIEERFLKE